MKDQGRGQFSRAYKAECRARSYLQAQAGGSSRIGRSWRVSSRMLLGTQECPLRVYCELCVLV